MPSHRICYLILLEYVFHSVLQRLKKVQIFHADDPEGSLPLYLRHNDPMCAPILSHYSPTSNVLLKITVPKRTGKRKRGSQDTYSEVGPNLLPTGIGGPTQNSNLCSHSRNDSSAQLLRTLRDNADKYQVEAVAEIERTHRFRGKSAQGLTCGSLAKYGF